MIRGTNGFPSSAVCHTDWRHDVAVRLLCKCGKYIMNAQSSVYHTQHIFWCVWNIYSVLHYYDWRHDVVAWLFYTCEKYYWRYFVNAFHDYTIKEHISFGVKYILFSSLSHWLKERYCCHFNQNVNCREKTMNICVW